MFADLRCREKRSRVRRSWRRLLFRRARARAIIGRERDRRRKKKRAKDKNKKKSLMPCERRDPSSVTPDEPPSSGRREKEGGGAGMPDLKLHSRFAEKGIARTSDRNADCADRSTYASTRLFPIADRRKNRRPIRSGESNLSRSPCI